MTNDVEMTTIRYRLVGPQSGKTVKLSKGKYSFVKGVMEISVREDHADKYKGMTRLLARAYNAHPDGSKALQRAEAEWAENKLNPAKLKDGGRDAGRQTDKAGKKKAGGEAPEVEGSDGAGDGAEGHEAETGDVDGAGDGSDDQPDPLVEALNKLNPDKEKHWTTTGLPSLKVLSEMLGYSVTRTEIEAVVPDFNREAARGAQ